MTALSDLPTVLSNSFESLPQEIDETESENRKSPLLSPLLTDSSPVLIVTAGYDHTIRFWDVLQGTCIATLQHNESVHEFEIFLFVILNLPLRFVAS